jgi:hypothetical protein
MPTAARGAFAKNSTIFPAPGRRAGDRPVDAGDRDESRPLSACPGCGRDGRGSHLSGVRCAGFGSSGGEDQRQRIGSGERWLGRSSVPAGPPCLERMYYDRASPSSLFRTNFLVSLFGIAGAGTACRSHSASDTAKIVPTDAENPIPRRRTLFGSLSEILYHGIRRDASAVKPLVPHRHQRIRVLVQTNTAPSVVWSMTGTPGAPAGHSGMTRAIAA